MGALKRFLGIDEDALEARHVDYDPSAFPLEWQLDAVIWHQGHAGYDSEAVPAVYAALDLISASIAQLETDPETPLSRTPDLFDTRFAFLFETAYSLAAAGDAFWLLTPTERGIETLQVLPPGEVTVTWDEEMPRRRRRYEWNGSPRESRYIRHLRFHPRPGELLGLSPIESSRLTWEGAAASEVWGSSLFGASGVPSGVLEVPTPLTPEESLELRNQWHTARNGVRNTAVLSGGMKYTPVELSPADIEWLETRASTAQEVARIFHIPSDFLEVAIQGGSSSITYRNLAEIGADLVRWCLRPYLRIIEEAWVSIPGQPPIRFNTDPLYEESMEARARTLQLLISSGADPADAADLLGFTDLTMDTAPTPAPEQIPA